MNERLLKDWQIISQSFDLSASTEQVKTINSGLINDSFIIKNNGQAFVLQRINTQVFNKPDAIQANFDKVSEHLLNKPYPYALLSTVKTVEKQSILHIDNNVWRLMPYVENSITINSIEKTDQAYSASQMVGAFDKALGDLDANDFYTTIPGFHDLTGRLEALSQVLKVDAHDRRKLCFKELQLVDKFSELGRWQSANLANGNLKIKVTHNDTKVTNQLFDSETRLAKALIDWDTIMPGCWLYDYADMIRSFVPSLNEESEVNSSLVLQQDIFQATSVGYLDATASEFSEFEKTHMLTAVQLIFFMLGVRFLTDFIDGDNYFKIAEDLQNLKRCRTQFALLEQLSRDLKYWKTLAG